MKNVTLLTLLSAGLLTACNPAKNNEATNKDSRSSKEILRDNLRATTPKGVMFGHHDDTVYGKDWEFVEDGSDVLAVCGDYPAVVSFDLGHLELGDSLSIDKVPFDLIRQEAVKQYQRGGLVSFSWHPRNPKTGGDSWDVSDKTVVTSILPGGENYEKFQQWLNNLNRFICSLQTEDGTKVPVLLRPWHEHTGSWFWWGQDLCTTDEYKQLWRMTTDYLEQNGAADQILYAYSTGTEPKDTAAYLERYPGDDIIEVIGFDGYQREDKNLYLNDMAVCLAVVDSIAKAHDKILAITETGYEAIPDSVWWTETLLPLMGDYPVSYVLLWRNAREYDTHFFGPYPGHASANDFIKFHQHPKTLFSKDVNLYEIGRAHV